MMAMFDHWQNRKTARNRLIDNSSVHRRALSFALLATVTASGYNTPSPARELEVGPGKPFALPSQAAAVATDGDHVKIAAGTYIDCAIWRANNLVIEGIEPGVVISVKTCMGKGLFVILGNNVTVRNLMLTRARVPDNNGAGIRAEGRNLTVERVKFLENENGILGASSPKSAVIIRDSDFERNGRCAEFCAHGVYFGDLALL